MIVAATGDVGRDEGGAVGAGADASGAGGRRDGRGRNGEPSFQRIARLSGFVHRSTGFSRLAITLTERPI
jgi:hypothetical protein